MTQKSMMHNSIIKCISVNYKTASLEVRGKLAFSDETIKNILKDIAENVPQCVLLCTCNRTEAYFCGDTSTVTAAFSENSGISISELAPHINSYEGGRAIKHLFRVAGGLTSMVLGEDEILSQTKHAYALSQECGAAGFELNRCFQAAISCGKNIRSSTAISQIPVSAATIAANAAADFGAQVRTLVIGASGKIGSSALKNLLAHKNVTVTATSRTHGDELRLSDKVKIVDFADRYSEIKKADCIISATSSPHYTVTLHGLRENGITGRKLFIDLAVPADIDPLISGADGFERTDIDRIGELAHRNNLARRDSAEAAKLIIDEESDKLKKELLYHWYKPCISAAEEKMKSSPESIIFLLKNELDAENFEAVLKALKGVK